MNVLAERHLERMGRLPGRRRSKDVAEHHEVAVHVRHLDADRRLAGDRRLDPDIRRRQRVRDVAGESEHLVHLGAGGHGDLVHRHRRAPVRRDDASVDTERLERPFERGEGVLLGPGIGVRGRSRSQQIGRWEVVGTLRGPDRPGSRAGRGARLGREGVGALPALRRDRLGLRRGGVHLRKDDDVLVGEPEGLLREPQRLSPGKPGARTLVLSGRRAHRVALIALLAELPDLLRDRGERRAGEDQQPEGRQARTHDRRPGR